MKGRLPGMDNEELLKIYQERGEGALDKKMGIKIILAEPGRMIGTMPVEGNTQPLGILHGGASVVFAETLGSFGSWIHAGADRKVVGIEISATHHKAATSGIVTGTATALSLGKTLCSWEIVITNDKGERTCTARLTCLILAER